MLEGLRRSAVWDALQALSGAAGPDREPAYARLFRELAAAGHASLPVALASGLLHGESLLPDGPPAGGMLRALEADLDTLNRIASAGWQPAGGLPQLEGLAAEADGVTVQWAELLAGGSLRLETVLEHFREAGSGPLARSRTFLWERSDLVPVTAGGNPETLFGLDHQLGRLHGTVTAWLDGGPPQNVLLYGPRGSGKSTAARSLQQLSAGLRMVGVQQSELRDLPALQRKLGTSRWHWVIFIDDLSWSAGESGWQALKPLLEGGLEPLPRNVMVLATSNRRRLIQQRFSDRPDPLDDDVHRWDSDNEKLALADRFAVTITFPSAGQRQYLELVSRLAAERGLQREDLHEAAIRHAEYGNGYSGRTARQFIDTLAH